MKILLAADQYPEYINGAANFTARLAAGLAERGHGVTVLWPSDDGRPRTYRQNGVTVHRVRSRVLPVSSQLRVCAPWPTPATIIQLLHSTSPDVVHVQSHMLLGRTLARAAARDNYPLIATNHFMPENVLPHIPVLRGFPRPVTRLAWQDLGRIYRLADLVTAPTPRAVELLEDAVGLRGVRAISCGIDVERYWRAAQAAPLSMVPTVLFVGRLEPEKRVDELLRAYARVPATLESRLEIIGIGSQGERLRTLASGLGLGERVTFRGRVSDAELAAAYGASDIFCIPGIAELQSLVTLEAMSAGKPVIAANAMALPHLVQPGRNGYLYTPGDLAGLSAHLTTLIAQPTLRHAMGRASRRMVDEHSIAATLNAFEGCYTEIRARPRSASAPVHRRVRRYIVPAFSPATATRRARTKSQKNGIAA